MISCGGSRGSRSRLSADAAKEKVPVENGCQAADRGLKVTRPADRRAGAAKD